MKTIKIEVSPLPLLLFLIQDVAAHVPLHWHLLLETHERERESIESELSFLSTSLERKEGKKRRKKKKKNFTLVPGTAGASPGTAPFASGAAGTSDGCLLGARALVATALLAAGGAAALAVGCFFFCV